MRILACISVLAVSAAAGDFTSLFDGRTLEGWEVCNGKATYRVEDGAIVGRTAEGSPNSFLCTTRKYGDFILEFEVKVDPALNSGVQIRSHRYAEKTGDHPAGRVYGYQVEIPTEKSGASGGVYDEARRGWLHNPKTTAFRDNEWNRYRVVAHRDAIKTWINEVPVADLVDPADQAGFIALQVHSYKGEKPAEVRWRNLRIHDMGRHEWKPIWDGRSLDGWTHKGGGTFTVEDGAIHAMTAAGDERVGMMMSDRSWGNVTARVRFRIARGNSGFFMRTDPQTNASYEVEIDAEKGTGGLWEVGGRRWVTGPEDNAAVVKDGWSELTASLHGRRIVFHLNGVKTVDLPNDVAGKQMEGRIALQAHGAKRPTEVWFKDLAVLEPVK